MINEQTTITTMQITMRVGSSCINVGQIGLRIGGFISSYLDFVDQ